MNSAPRVRPLEPIPFKVKDQQLVALRDPMHFIEEAVTVTVPVYLLLCLMDGTRTVFDLQKDYRDQYGPDLAAYEIEGLIGDLDKNGLLAGERFSRLREEKMAEFSAANERKAAYAGAAYEAEPEALRAQLGGFYAQAAETQPEGEPMAEGRTVRGLVAPHIDPRVGGVCAARAYKALAASPEPPELFVLFGTAHQPGTRLFTLTDKTFTTPLGATQTDGEVARALEHACGPDLKADEYLHKYEHSLEFQILFLQHLYGADHAFRILPILVGSFHEFLAANTIPSTDEAFRDFSDALRSVLATSGRRVCFVAGADLSHMGRKFGDGEGLSEGLIAAIRARDREMLGHLERGEQEEFFRHLQVDGDRQKVCGLPPIYAMMDAMGPGCRATLLDYGLHTEPETESFVSFASLAFHD